MSASTLVLLLELSESARVRSASFLLLATEDPYCFSFISLANERHDNATARTIERPCKIDKIRKFEIILVINVFLLYGCYARGREGESETRLVQREGERESKRERLGWCRERERERARERLGWCRERESESESESEREERERDEVGVERGR